MRSEPFLEGYARDFSREMGDPEHVRENHAHLSRLYRESGLEPDAFVARLYEARSTTANWLGNITKRRRASEPGAAPDGQAPAKNRAPYFFAVLTSLLRPAAERTPAPIDPEAVWAEACHRLLVTVGTASVHTWIAPARPIGRRRGAFVVEAPNGFLFEWLDGRYRADVELALAHVLGRPTGLEVVRRGGAAGSPRC